MFAFPFLHYSFNLLFGRGTTEKRLDRDCQALRRRSSQANSQPVDLVILTAHHHVSVRVALKRIQSNNAAQYRHNVFHAASSSNKNHVPVVDGRLAPIGHGDGDWPFPDADQG